MSCLSRQAAFVAEIERVLSGFEPLLGGELSCIAKRRPLAIAVRRSREVVSPPVILTRPRLGLRPPNSPLETYWLHTPFRDRWNHESKECMMSRGNQNTSGTHLGLVGTDKLESDSVASYRRLDRVAHSELNSIDDNIDLPRVCLDDQCIAYLSHPIGDNTNHDETPRLLQAKSVVDRHSETLLGGLLPAILFATREYREGEHCQGDDHNASYHADGDFHHSLPNDLDENSLSASPVELVVEDMLPGTEVQPAVGDGDDDLAAHDLTLVVGVGVVLTGAVV